MVNRQPVSNETVTDGWATIPSELRERSFVIEPLMSQNGTV
jgi:hypothetical protein